MALNDNHKWELFNRKAKVVCTIGPSTNDYESIKKLILAGMNVARLNFSHGDHESHKEVYSFIRKASVELERPIAILQDIQGPKIRIGDFEQGEIELKAGDTFVLTTRPVSGNQQMVSVSYPSFPKDVKEGDSVLLDDGILLLKVEKVEYDDVTCRVVNGGTLKNKKGINLPGSKLSVDILTDKDKKDLDFGVDLGMDYIALSFVQSPEDIKMVKNIISYKGKSIPVIAKIEKPQAVECIEELVEVADGIMVARGDLGVEMKVEEVPSIQKKIIQICNRRSKPVITATQMLESMVHNFRPTRAEASDVANAVLDGTDAVMLSAESAAGKFPIEATRTMARIITHTEQEKQKNKVTTASQTEKISSIPTSIGFGACQTATMVNAKAIVCLTLEGKMAKTMARFRPSKPIIAVSSKPQVLNRLALVWGVYPFPNEDLTGDIDDCIAELMVHLRDRSAVNRGDFLVITTGQPFNKPGPTNSIQVQVVE